MATDRAQAERGQGDRRGRRVGQTADAVGGRAPIAARETRLEFAFDEALQDMKCVREVALFRAKLLGRH